MTFAIFADAAKRTISGLLLPFGELSRPASDGTKPIMFSAGTVQLPTDPSTVTLNSEHSQFEPRGRAIAITETDKGISAEFAIAQTSEGDALLAAALNPDPAQRPRLSAEIKQLQRQGDAAVSAVLTGAAACARGAFPSASFSAVDEAVNVLEEEAPEEELTADAAKTLAETVTAAVLDAITTTDPATNTETETPKGDTMTASVPAALRRSSNTAPNDSTTRTGLFAALAQARKTGDRSALEPYTVGEAAFAMANINHEGANGKTVGNDIQQPAYIGQLWARRAYQRRFFGLTNTGILDSFEINGWRFVEGKTPEVDAYEGNGKEIPSNEVDTEPVKASARRIAGGHRIDRRYVDFPDQGFFEAYFDSMLESYLRKSDADALKTLVTAATTVAPGTVPTEVAPGLAAIVDGALGVIATENTPAFAVVSNELWRDIVLTGKNEVLGYLTAAFGLEEGNLSGFKILPGAVGTGKVLVGAKEARTMYELPGAPIRVEGLVPANGQIEPALYGYIGDITHNAKALSLVTVAGTK